MSKKRGFTVLEIVLVLAIAGVIFLMVFIALPQMQRQQRDSRRKDDMMLFVEAIKKYQSNYRGTLPKLPNGVEEQEFGTMIKEDIVNSSAKDDTWPGFWAKYIEDGFSDPREGYYNLTVRVCNEKQGDACADQDKINYDTTIYVYTGGTCKEDRAVMSSNPRDFAVVYHTESSGLYCFDSSNGS